MKERKKMESMWFKLRSAEKVRCADWRHPLGYLDSHLLLINVDGEPMVAVDGNLVRLHPGCAFVGLPGQLLQALPPGENGDLYILRFDTIEEDRSEKPGLRVTERSSAFPFAGEIALSDAVRTNEICLLAAMDWQCEGTRERLRAQAALLELISRLAEDGDSKASASEAALSRTIAYMERHSERNITIDELAEMAGLSRYYYMRLFKSSYGISAMDYLTELRMNKAKRLMEQSKPKLREIAGQVGYADEFYFIRKFR